MKLDVGCGSNPQGDVNCDLFVTDVGHRSHQKGKTFDVKKVPNFVVCDAQRLPFKDNCFDEVFSRHTIEHVADPVMCLDEMLRVSSDRITVLCPHWLGDRFGLRVSPHHVSFFNMKWFLEYIRKRPVFGLVVYSRYKIPLLLLTLPSELTVTMRKLFK